MPGSAFPRQGKRGQRKNVYEKRFLALTSASADIFWVVTASGSLLTTGANWQCFTGQAKHQATGYGWLDILYPADREQIEAALLQVVARGAPDEIECHMQLADGTYHLLHLRLVPVPETDGPPREVILCGTDITKQEQSGQMSDAQIQLALKASRVGMWIRHCLTGQIQWTDQERALLGWPPSTPATLENFLASIHPEDRERVAHIIDTRQWIHQQEYTMDYRVIWPDGSIHWLSDRAFSSCDAYGRPLRLLGATIDITALKQAEQQVTSILESITDAFSYVDKQWRYTYVNRGLEKMIGKKREEVLGRSFWEMLPEIVGTPFERVYRETMETQQPGHIEGFHPSFRRWLDIRIYPTPQGISFDLHDITERKQAEDALRESEARFRGLMDANLIGIVVSDLEGHIREVNQATLDLLEYTQEDVATGRMNWLEMNLPEYRARHRHIIAQLLREGKIQPYEKEYLTKSGKRVPVLLGITLYRREDGEPLALTFIVNLSAQKEIERQKDLFLGMTSHELKTPLATLKGTLQLMQRRVKRTLEAGDTLPPTVEACFAHLSKSIADSLRQVDVQTRLINDLLDVSRITSNTLRLSPGRYDLKQIVRQTVGDLQVMSPRREIQLMLPEDAEVFVLIDRDRISQVLTNYITNALRYSSPGQPVQVGLHKEGHTARVWVRDQGPGLSAEACQDIWKRFHQSRDVPVLSGEGKGLGLGLYICQTLIKQHQGEVGVESTPGQGSTFWFTLPLAD